jgi:hypothetical protein
MWLKKFNAKKNLCATHVTYVVLKSSTQKKLMCNSCALCGFKKLNAKKTYVPLMCLMWLKKLNPKKNLCATHVPYVVKKPKQEIKLICNSCASCG